MVNGEGVLDSSASPSSGRSMVSSPAKPSGAAGDGVVLGSFERPVVSSVGRFAIRSEGDLSDISVSGAAILAQGDG